MFFCFFFKKSVCAVLKVQLCPALGPQARIVPPNLSWHLHHFPALQVWMDITQPSIKPPPSHPLPVIVLDPSLSHPLCNYKVAEAVSPVSRRLAAWHWEWRRKRFPLSLPCTFPHSPGWWARRRRCQRWWLCTHVSTWAVSFPVHHCAGEADDWIQSVRWLMRAPPDLGQPINHVIRANVPWKRQTSAKE